MNKRPHQLTSVEFAKTFPFFSELPPRSKWRLYRIHNKINLEETGEECSWEEFCEFAAEPFRWDVENAAVLWSDDHRYFIQEALRDDIEVPSDVLAEYPDLVEEHLQRKRKAKSLRDKRREKLKRMKEKKAYERATSKEDREFWSNF